MAYDLKKTLNNIVNAKGSWTDYNSKGYNDLANQTAAKAQKYYQQLIDSGNADIANKLKGYDYETARKFADTYNQVAGRTKTRDYLYTLGQGRNMSKSDIDSLISYNDTTGEVSFGGKIVGKPDAVYEGTSYWSDTKPLDDAFNDYVKRTNTTLDTGVKNQVYNVAAQGVRDKNDKLNDTIYSDHADMHSKYDKIYDYANQDVTGTDEYKSAFKNIMPSYNLAAMQGRDNAVASGGASNGGNIDSYAAANALRQQAALTAKGQALAHQAGMDAYNARIGRVQEILSNLGLYNQNTYNATEGTINNDRLLAQQIFDNEETAKNNDVARKSQIASVTGYSPDEWVVSNNPYLNDDGTIKDEYKNVDFKAVMEKAKASGNTKAYDAAAQARYYKIMGDYGLFGQYDDGDYILPGQQKAEEARQFDVQDETARLLADAANDTEIKKANIGAQSAYDTEMLKAKADLGVARINAEGKKTGGKDENVSGNPETGEQAAWDSFYSSFTSNDAKRFLNERIKPLYFNDTEITMADLMDLVSNSVWYGYKLSKDDKDKILNAFAS